MSERFSALHPRTICAEPEPTVSYFWPGGILVQLHAGCDALWQQERPTQ